MGVRSNAFGMANFVVSALARYDVSIKIQVEANSTTNATSSTEAPCGFL